MISFKAHIFGRDGEETGKFTYISSCLPCYMCYVKEISGKTLILVLPFMM